jgi:3-dehydroquinate dehydratase-1
MWAPFEAPIVVGTSRPDGLQRLLGIATRDSLADIVEARLDLAAARAGGGGSRGEIPDLTAFLPACERLQAAGTPVLLTVRLVSDGGRWTDDTGRLALFEQAIASRACSWVDIEVESAIAAAVVDAAHASGAVAIVSHHDFGGTPEIDALAAIVDEARHLGADIVKIATRVDALDDHDRLLEILRRGRAHALAIIGMGPFGTSLRTYLPCVGSRLTYGFLDEAAAPGQIAAPDLVARLVTDCPAYAARRRLPAPGVT